ARLGVELLDADRLALHHAVLLTAGDQDCVHGIFLLRFCSSSVARCFCAAGAPWRAPRAYRAQAGGQKRKSSPDNGLGSTNRPVPATPGVGRFTPPPRLA